ncbi:MMPL family protein, partial [Vibrio parahaemolyticus V-223/04]
SYRTKIKACSWSKCVCQTQQHCSVLHH